MTGASTGTIPVKGVDNATYYLPISNVNGQAAMAASSPVTLAVDQTALVVQGGTVASPLALGLDSSLQSIIAAIKGQTQVTGTIWYDASVNPVVYYVRRETEVETSTGTPPVFTSTIAISWETITGGIAAAPAIGFAGLIAMSDSENVRAVTTVYAATASGSGYAQGDILVHVFGVDTTSATTQILAYSFWLNASTSGTGTVLTAAPLSANVTQSTSAAQDGTDVTGSAMPAGGGGIRGWLSAIYGKLMLGISVIQTIGGAAISAANPMPCTIPGRPFAPTTTAISLQTATYPTNTCLGGLGTLTSALGTDLCATLQDVALNFNVPITGMMTVVLFNAAPTASTFTDNAVVSLAKADIGKIVWCQQMSASSAVAGLGVLASSYRLDGQCTKIVAPGQTLYYAIITGTAVTFAASSTVQANFVGDLG